MTGAAGTLRANPAERPIYLAFTPNFSAFRVAPKPSTAHIGTAWATRLPTIPGPRWMSAFCPIASAVPSGADILRCGHELSNLARIYHRIRIVNVG